MSQKLAATFHGSGSSTPVFITKVGVGTPTQVTPEAAEGLMQIGWTPPRPVPTDAQIIGPSRSAWDDTEWRIR